MVQKLDVPTRISKARAQLLLDQPWFGTLALRLKIIEDTSVPTMANDGTILYYNSAYVKKLSDAELLGVVAHEVMHCALGHMFRIGGRNHQLWNIAADIAINPILTKSGFTLPAGVLGVTPDFAQFKGMFSEQIYALLDKQRQKGAGGKPGDTESADGLDHDCDCGLRPASSKDNTHSTDRMTETDWQILTKQATDIARRAGKLPAHIDRLVSSQEEPTVDWRTVLRRFIEQQLPSDYSWMHPSRRYISRGIYLPGIIKENVLRIGIAVDTSGSIDQEMLNLFASEITAIVHEVRPERLDVVYCDAKVQAQESFSPDDPKIVLHAKGGGGTAFQPALDVFNQDPPVCVIYLTDLYGPAPIEPEYPVLWAVPEASKQAAPFGERVTLSKFERT